MRRHFLLLQPLAYMAALLFAVMLAPTTASSQTLTIKGLASLPAALSVAAVEAAGLTEIRDARQISAGGQTETREIIYQGVTLPRLLEVAGIGAVDRYKVRTATVTVVAQDGYQAVFSWGELFNSPVGDRVLVILRENGAVSGREGPFSLRSFGDLRPGPRHVRLVSEIRVTIP